MPPWQKSWQWDSESSSNYDSKTGSSWTLPTSRKDSNDWWTTPTKTGWQSERYESPHYDRDWGSPTGFKPTQGLPAELKEAKLFSTVESCAGRLFSAILLPLLGLANTGWADGQSQISDLRRFCGRVFETIIFALCPTDVSCPL